MEDLLMIPVFTIVAAIFAILVLLHFVPVGLWISALAAGCLLYTSPSPRDA